MYWVLYELSWPEAGEAFKAVDLAIIPTGSIEQHGPHLPLINDYALAEAIARAAAESSEAKVLIAPALMAGVSPHHMNFPGTIALRPETFISVLYDVAHSLKRHGLRRLIILNGHGGNTPAIQLLLRRLRDELGIEAVAINYWLLIPDISREVIESKIGGHAGEFETSVALIVHPEKVRKDKIGEPNLKRIPLPYSNPGDEARVLMPVNWEEYTENGVLGFPSLASEDKGKKLFEAIVSRVKEFIEEFARN